MSRLPLLLVFPSLGVFPTLGCLVPAPQPAPQPPGAPIEVVVRLDPADRALFERLLARGGEAAPSAGPRREPPAIPRDPMRLIHDGPVAQASYNSGAPMYQGEQVLLDGRWQRHGPWRAWYADGRPWEEGAYRHDEEHGPWRWWYENGAPQAAGTFNQGLRIGEWVYYFENGQVMAQGVYANDRPVGQWRTFNEDGSLASQREH